ncbi:MAG: hypothetical protein WC294_06000 [Methanoregula sp.]
MTCMVPQYKNEESLGMGMMPKPWPNYQEYTARDVINALIVVLVVAGGMWGVGMMIGR